MYNGQRVELHFVLLQLRDPAHHAIEGGRLSLIYAITVVQFPRPVNRNANKKSMLSQELAPYVIHEHTVCLQRIVNDLAVSVLLLQFDDPAEEIHSQQRGLAALPGEMDLICRLRCNVLTNISFEHLTGHRPLLRVRI